MLNACLLAGLATSDATAMLLLQMAATVWAKVITSPESAQKTLRTTATRSGVSPAPQPLPY